MSPALEELFSTLKTTLRGDLRHDETTKKRFSRDTSIFSRTPSLVIFPKNTEDVQATVVAALAAKKQDPTISITARSAGSDMTGGPLSTSIVMSFTEHMNQITEVGEGYAVVEPGAYYRDFEKRTLAKNNQILPSYPASRELAALGGMFNNDSGGERTLEYGKTRDYVESVDVVLSDGSTATFGPLSPEAFAEKANQNTFEGSIYRGMKNLLAENQEHIARARPEVSKNSAGYALWDIVDAKTGTYNLAKLLCGSQGTLALTTKMRLTLIKNQPYRSMLVVFLQDIALLPEIVTRVLRYNPESFESYDNHTFSLALRFLPQMLSQMGPWNAFRLGLSFLPEFFMVLRGGIPTLVLMAEFSEDTQAIAEQRAKEAEQALTDLPVKTRVNKTERASEKYWKVRRESFALLRKNARGLYAAPFIDDFVIKPEVYPEFLPKLNALLAEYKKHFIYTIAGHVGNGNFHIIPLVDLSKPESRKCILELTPKVYDLVLSYHGSITGEHNDGILRTPYLKRMFGDEVIALFEKTKNIFDPQHLFNPGKKVYGSLEDIERDMMKQSP